MFPLSHGCIAGSDRFTRWITNKHILKHPFNTFRFSGVTDKIGSELAFAGIAKWHIVTQYVDVLAILFNTGEYIMSITGFISIPELNV